MISIRSLGLALTAILALGACGGSGDVVGPGPTDSAAAPTSEAADESAPEPAEEVPVEESAEEVLDIDEESPSDPPGDEVGEDVENAAPTVWDVSPLRSGCTPGPSDQLPDGHWFGFAVEVEDGAVDFDLACVWDRDELYEAGVIAENEVFPNDYVLNDNPLIRTLETAADGVAHMLGDDAEPVEMKLQTEWGETHTGWGGVECPSALCYVSVLVEDGVIVELRERYQS